MRLTSISFKAIAPVLSASRLQKPIVGIALIALASTVSAASLNDGLVVYYPLDGSPNDASGNGYHGLAVGGVTFETAIKGQAAKFNGSTSYIQAPNTSVGNLGENATLSFWFLAASNNVAGHRIVEKDDRAYWWFYAGPDYVVADVRSSQSYGDPQWHLVAQTPSNTDEAWTAVALRKTETTLDLFINGQSIQSVPNAATSVVTTAPLTLGRSYFWNSFYYSGLLDEVRIYDRALSNGEIAQLAAIPEPSMWLMLIPGLALLTYRLRTAKRDA